MWVWKDSRERWLLAAVVSAFVLVCLVNVKLPLWGVLEGRVIASFLRADATISVTSDLLVGLISAYIFYVIIELLPSHRRKAETFRVLNLLVASVVDAFDRTRLFGHETPIISVDLDVLKLARLESNIAIVRAHPEFLRLKYAMETGDSRYQDFQHALSLAIGLSPEHALGWLVLTDKIRLLASEYGQQPVNPVTENFMVERPDDHMGVEFLQVVNDFNRAQADFEGALQLRVLEVFEASVNWMKLQNTP
ncbi:hypothetical protein [Pseudomonas sp. GM67]|uniref:hypothetical protein n=1 Tax=Pseudomonas sp. GM67 TaxID=1144335 RepID=UPI000270CB00|nr:hypothetical protein [Pseudomonas sp. GM67]EJM94705.1 hypothetical protein PMI33_00126 [Pseudomonas sp. GM67]